MVKEKIIIIGLLEEANDKNTFKLLKKMFNFLGYSQNSVSKSSNFFIFNKEDSNILLIDIESNTLSCLLKWGFQFDIIIHTSFDNLEFNSNKLKELVASSKYLIINSDDEKWTYLLNDNITTIIITYGFNNKATINLSSFDKDDAIEANICIQREIQTIDKKIVEPFELPVKINSREKINIYSILSVIACGIVMGIDFTNINISLIYNRYQKW